MVDPRVLDEQIPFQCTACGFTYWRRLDELRALRERGKAVFCPDCHRPQSIDWDEVDEATDFLSAMQELDDSLGPTFPEDDPDWED